MLKGFGFLSLDNEEAINKIVAERYVTINGKKVIFLILFYILYLILINKLI